MGCGCGGARSAKKEYVYVDGNGKQTTYPSQIAAEAAKIRNRGVGSVRQKQ